MQRWLGDTPRLNNVWVAYAGTDILIVAQKHFVVSVLGYQGKHNGRPELYIQKGMEAA
jgi:hypothetical protein